MFTAILAEFVFFVVILIVKNFCIRWSTLTENCSTFHTLLFHFVSSSTYVVAVYVFGQGRTNKLVDGCYSLWQGGVFPLLHHVLKKQDDEALSSECWMFDQGEKERLVASPYNVRWTFPNSDNN